MLKTHQMSRLDSKGHKGVMLSDQEVAELRITARGTTRVKTKVGGRWRPRMRIERQKLRERRGGSGL